MAKNVLALALRWAQAHDMLQGAKTHEMALRTELVAAVFPGGLAAGTNTADVAGYKVKAVVSPKAKFLTDPKAALARLVKLGPAGVLLAERLVKWKPDLSLGEWKKLGPKHQALFKDVVEIQHSAPAVELVAPK